MKRFFNEEPEDDGPAKKQVFDKGKARSVSTPVVSQGFSLDLSAGLPDVQETFNTSSNITMDSFPGDDAVDPPLSSELSYNVGRRLRDRAGDQSEAEEVIEVIPATQIEEDKSDEQANLWEVYLH
ncbi:hypothetical protein THAR02_09549 [Trichoderma harzianum]|uniref:Uncharacterized protein n=1 Tax=Trichoderma harzianum TaxID=5544 RepID=A0A0F9ZYR8_TRIHA|nr:hypothetical protein THAR02_09549 [Trichoderma harzianum]